MEGDGVVSLQNAFVVCPACGRDDVELPVVGDRAVGMCPECYAAISLPVECCSECGELLGASYMSLDVPGTCLFCVSGD